MPFLSSDSSQQTTPHKNLNSFSVERVVCAYEKEGDRLINEFVLKEADLSELQALFGESEGNLMVECYPITRIHADYLQHRFHLMFDFNAFDYFLECNPL